MKSNKSKALVLSGGGITGIAWELGVLRGLKDGGVDVTNAELVVGTSASSSVGAQITSSLSLEELYKFQLKPIEETKEGRRSLMWPAVPWYFLIGVIGILIFIFVPWICCIII